MRVALKLAPVALATSALVSLGAGLGARSARASTFDEQGVFVADASASGFEPFSSPERYLPEDADPSCADPQFTVIEDETLALEGSSFARVAVSDVCAERFVVHVPASQGSYRSSVWIRHGSGEIHLVAKYPDDSGVTTQIAYLAPTGRATSDGWIELASNELPFDGTVEGAILYLLVSDYAAEDGIDVDALEITSSGTYRDAPSCEGVHDPVCGDDALCVGGTCRLGNPSVPPLPDEAIRDQVVDMMKSRLQVFFGGQWTRQHDLPVALETLDSMRSATSAWKFWNGFATAIHQLHDWHTNINGPIQGGPVPKRLSACFIEGDADLTRSVAPSDPQYRDILVSHAAETGNAGLHAGDRLVAIDGMHPIAWARSLVDVNWGYHTAPDPTSFADFPEALGGRGLIVQFAKTLTVLRCDAAAGTCSDTLETIQVADIENQMSGMGGGLSCDNRPSYHLGASSPPPNHHVFGNVFRGAVDGTTPEEAIYGMVWDTLYGGGDPNSALNTAFKTAIADWKANARGVILDHRAGNGGTIDSPELLTTLVRPAEDAAVYLMPIETAGYEGPTDATEGILLFNQNRANVAYHVGADDYAADLPVALIIHRDGSASDYLPFGMKGAPKTRIFGPGPTAGAFSTFIQFYYWGSLSFQFASGDTITKDGAPLIGHAVMPDEIVQQKQSDLIHGVDTIHEAALAWVRQELRP